MLQSRRSHRRQCNTVHALCMLDNYGYKHTFRICSNYCFSTATMVKRTRLHDTLHVPCLTCYTTDGACLPHGTKWIFKCTVRLWRVNQINNLNYKFNSLIDSISPRLSLHHFTGEYIVMRYKLFICHFFFFFTHSWNFNHECRAAFWIAALHFRGIISLTRASHSCGREAR